MILVDTNVIFALQVESSYSTAARALVARYPEVRTESHALVELTNVLTRYVRTRLMSVDEALAALGRAENQLQGNVVSVAHAEALKIALDRKISAYDARFLVAARALGVKLVTEDAKLRNAAPDLAHSLAEALVA